ncbi:hypothetical protein [Escherichia phage AV115]|uniref:Uncharacterized protein RB69ORF135c n=1 Tax=Escherichia phage RB69 TaxID=12353 RepID=Q7Y510_BPR69|nr:RB69ORF135c hypothetical protein [Escherichia phage RB69]QBP05748.1 hypothetical protein [Escherichia phage PHB12]WLY86539.1 hypothetical protein 348Ecol098PP_00058 [Escherichia phage 348Ecol098PP]WPK35390.1 hypothetical protein [Escherichia phage AV115]WPK36177.1 hypothetical protein [Escherichia phage AV118]AAP76037.1 RB69ORF135c hypothetical protein [Escherichia phage RB69]
MIYYESIGTKVVAKTITREKFAKIFDMRYKKSEHKGIRFEDAHCTICPYNEDINGTIVPLVEASHDDLWDEYDIACREI